MKPQLTRITAIAALAALLLAIASGCARGGADESGAANSELSEYIYTVQSVPFPREAGVIYGTAYHNDKVYFNGTNTETIYADGDNAELFITNVQSDIYTIGINGSGFAKLASYMPTISPKDGISSGVYVTHIAVDDEGFIWVVEEWSYHTFNLPAGFDASRNTPWEHQEIIDNGYLVRKLDANGGELLRIDIGELQGWYDDFIVAAFAVYSGIGGAGGAGTSIFLSFADFDRTGQTVYVLDEAGNIQLRLKTDHNFSHFIKMPDGTVAMPPSYGSVAAGAADAHTLPTIDLSLSAFGKTIEVPNVGGQFAYEVYYHKGSPATDAGTPAADSPATDGFDLLISDNISLYGYALGADAAEKLLNWQDCNIVVGSIHDIYVLPDGRIICTSNLRGGAQSAEILFLTKTRVSELPGKTVITLADFIVLPTTRELVAEFNKTSLTHSIQIIDYSELNPNADQWASLDIFMNEVSAGKVPDILGMHILRGMGLENTGLLADLYPFIDADFIDALIDALPPSGGGHNIDDALIDIITESASGYFNGAATAEDAAREIQSRASIYVSERS